jgi:hypothetical protein
VFNINLGAVLKAIAVDDAAETFAGRHFEYWKQADLNKLNTMLKARIIRYGIHCCAKSQNILTLSC